MTNKSQRIVEITCLALLVLLSHLGICWGDPPGPPVITPVGNTEMSALTVVGMAAYGYWKMKK